MAVEAFLIGECGAQQRLPSRIRERCKAPVIAVNDRPSLEHTLELFNQALTMSCASLSMSAKFSPASTPFAAARASASSDNGTELGPIRVFSDGRDPQINGVDFPLPRRERRILEYLIANRGRRLNKAQIFSAIYGIFDSEVEENVVESHISKLRKKLRQQLGFDPIDSKRFLGYCINIE